MTDRPVVIPAFARIEQALAEADRQRILDWILAHEDRFEAASVLDEASWDSGGTVDRKRRIALVTRECAEIEPELRALFLDRSGSLAAGAGFMEPLPDSLELEIAAHNDGAHFIPHLDIPVGSERKPLGNSADEDRVLSAVYYLNRRPKGFSGGALRLYGFGAGPVEERPFVDIEPSDNSLVAFPSWAMHEVRPVECPTRAFADSRFAVNCWFCR